MYHPLTLTSVVSQFFQVVASKLPEFDRMPPVKTEVKAQEVINLRCRSKPPLILPTLKDWRKDGQPLLELAKNSSRISTSSGNLLIRSATREDSGNYTCTLVNTEGNVTSNVSEVIVKGKIFNLLTSSILLRTFCEQSFSLSRRRLRAKLSIT